MNNKLWEVELQKRQKSSDIVSVALIGDDTYEHKGKIRNMLVLLKNKFGNKLEVVTRAMYQGAEKYVRKYAIEMGIRYKEFPIASNDCTLYSVMPEDYFQKQFHPTHIPHRDGLLVVYCDKVVIFSNKTSKTFNVIISKSTKLKKKITIIDDKE